jgi:uncharacterized membrane protein YtjA (UPF0391 family)
LFDGINSSSTSWRIRRGTALALGAFTCSDERDTMFKFAIIFLIISLVAGAVGMTNVSVMAKRISLILFGLFFLGFLALLGFAYLLGAAFNAGQQSMLLGATLA